MAGYHRKTGNSVFLHIRRLRHEKDPAALNLESSAGAAGAGSADEGPEKKITRLAIGVEGGFDADAGKDKYTYEEVYQVVVLPTHTTLPFPNAQLPAPIVDAVNAIIAAESATKKSERESVAGTWDGEVRMVSKYVDNLEQLVPANKIPPSGWKCQNCDLTTNLWLNLTDGSILCGRRFFDGTGGNDHAVEHYRTTGHPLAVKLGTITADGKGDVYSYKEDDMVENPHLAKHLNHFGIKVQQLEKTDKSMVELELDLNQRVGEWNLMCESASNLEPISGPGYTGMRNLGNSCYLNSVMQVMFTLPDFVQRYVAKAPEIFGAYPADPANDFNVQMAKLGTGLLSGKYSNVAGNALDSETSSGVAPIMFKQVIGKGHSDFAGKQQQDAQEFFLHLVSVLERNSRNQVLNPADAVKFSIEDRVECVASGKVKYTHRDDYCLPLPIPLHLAKNVEEVRDYERRAAEAEKRGEKMNPDDLVRPKVALSDCLDAFCAEEVVDQFYSTAIRGLTQAKKTQRLATLPDFLMLHMKKFTLREDWTSVKLDVSVECPDVLDIGHLRGVGQQPTEQSLPELEEGAGAPKPPPIDAAVLDQLVQMGFPVEAGKKAIFHTKNTGVEAATNWVMEHITDPDFSDPFVMPGMEGNKASGAAFVADANGLEMLMGMGFTDKQATRALKETQNNIERAADWIFSHPDELDAMDVDEASNQSGAAMDAQAGGAGAKAPAYRDGGSGEWRRRRIIKWNCVLCFFIDASAFVCLFLFLQLTSWWRSSRTWARRRRWGITCATS